MNCVEKFFPEVHFGGFSRFDGTVSFYSRVNALLKMDYTVLDVGCGRGAFQDNKVKFRKELRILRGKVKKVIGLDVDPKAKTNPFLDEFVLLPSPFDSWPIEDQSIDLIVSDWTLEHVANPIFFFDEVYRVLKPGGYFCARTTNKWGYVAVGARIIPEGFQSKLIKFLQSGRRYEEDIFPTVYACNTLSCLKRMLKMHKLKGIVYAFSGLPGYLDFSCFLFYLGYLFEKFVPQQFRHTLFVFAQKDSDSQ